MCVELVTIQYTCGHTDPPQEVQHNCQKYRGICKTRRSSRLINHYCYVCKKANDFP